LDEVFIFYLIGHNTSNEVRKVFDKKVSIFMLVVVLACSGSILAWFYFSNDLPKKMPVRAKQVFRVSEYNNLNNVQTTNEPLTHQIRR
jgi:flagellar basal body-associated protein FliL